METVGGMSANRILCLTKAGVDKCSLFVVCAVYSTDFCIADDVSHACFNWIIP